MIVAKILFDEINRKKQALAKTKSSYLTVDYAKSIIKDVRELKYYCKAKNINIKDLED